MYVCIWTLKYIIHQHLLSYKRFQQFVLLNDTIHYTLRCPFCYRQLYKITISNVCTQYITP